MKKILLIGDQLQRMIDKAELEADKIITDAQKKADEMILQEKTKLKRKLIRAQRAYKQTEEKKIKIESSRILEEYQKKVSLMKKIPNDRLMIAINLILNRVLPQ